MGVAETKIHPIRTGWRHSNLGPVISRQSPVGMKKTQPVFCLPNASMPIHKWRQVIRDMPAGAAQKETPAMTPDEVAAYVTGLAKPEGMELNLP